MRLIISIINRLYFKFYVKKNSGRYIKWLRKKGIKIGHECFFIRPDVVEIDYTRPSLIEIGNNVRMNRNFSIYTHDFSTAVFLKKKSEFMNSSGRVKIGNNIWFGANCTILKGVNIGDNCIIGVGSVVTKDIPANSVASGIPAKVICGLDDYYEKRKKKSIEEACDYAKSIQERFGRRPVEADFFEEFPLFVNGDEIDKYPTIPIRRQLKGALPEWEKNHKAIFSSFEDFLKVAGIS